MNFAAFDLNLLRVFDAMMRERSVTRAGEQIGLSQPAVSAALQRLRDLLEDKLFVRLGNDMVPTPRAESLAPGIRDALEGLERLLVSERRFEPSRLERTFTLMGADFFGTLFIPPLMQVLNRHSRGINLRFLDSAAGDVERLLKDDAIDMALEREFEPPEYVSYAHLFASPFKIVLRADHPAIAGLKPGENLSLDTLCALDWAIRSIDGSMNGWTDAALEKLGRKRRVVLAVPTFHAVVASVKGGDIAAAIPEQFATAVGLSEGLHVLEMPLAGPTPELRLYWHARRTRDPAHAWLREQIIDLCAMFRATAE
jgi:DNA-binding transcriptional LysR family regulator